jgi:hypothetical protein
LQESPAGAQKQVIAVPYSKVGSMRAGWIFCVTVLIWLAASPLAAQPAQPFEGMAGSWTGTGTITLGTGDKERIRCRAQYTLENNGLHVVQDLRCASDSYKFEMVNELDYLNGNISGRWDERTRRTGGSITGRARLGPTNRRASHSTPWK